MKLRIISLILAMLISTQMLYPTVAGSYEYIKEELYIDTDPQLKNITSYAKINVADKNITDYHLLIKNFIKKEGIKGKTLSPLYPPALLQVQGNFSLGCVAKFKRSQIMDGSSGFWLRIPVVGNYTTPLNSWEIEIWAIDTAADVNKTYVDGSGNLHIATPGNHIKMLELNSSDDIVSYITKHHVVDLFNYTMNVTWVYLNVPLLADEWYYFYFRGNVDDGWILVSACDFANDEIYYSLIQGESYECDLQLAFIFVRGVGNFLEEYVDDTLGKYLPQLYYDWMKFKTRIRIDKTFSTTQYLNIIIPYYYNTTTPSTSETFKVNITVIAYNDTGSVSKSVEKNHQRVEGVYYQSLYLTLQAGTWKYFDVIIKYEDLIDFDDTYLALWGEYQPSANVTINIAHITGSTPEIYPVKLYGQSIYFSWSINDAHIEKVQMPIEYVDFQPRNIVLEIVNWVALTLLVIIGGGLLYLTVTAPGAILSWAEIATLLKTIFLAMHRTLSFLVRGAFFILVNVGKFIIAHPFLSLMIAALVAGYALWGMNFINFILFLFNLAGYVIAIVAWYVFFHGFGLLVTRGGKEAAMYWAMYFEGSLATVKKVIGRVRGWAR